MREGQRGVTLVELMITMVIALLMMGLVFTLYVRMSTAYRAEVVKTELQQVARSCPGRMANDVRLAGYTLSRFRIATGAFGAAVTDDLPPVMIENDADGWGPDLVRVYYADPTAQANVTDMAPDRASVTVDDNGQFEVGDLVALVAPNLVVPGDGAASFMDFQACVVRLTDAPDDTLEFIADAAGLPYNNAGNTHCGAIAEAVGASRPVQALLFHGRAYRIDPDPGRRALGVYQMSPSGELEADDWVDMGLGFTDLQVASRYFEASDGVDVDEDGDPEHDWYSAGAQEDVAPATERPDGSILTQVSLSVAVRTHADVTGVASTNTPSFIDEAPGLVAYNPFGDSPSVDLTAAQADLPEQHRGSRIYRSSTVVIDVRNLGIGR